MRLSLIFKLVVLIAVVIVNAPIAADENKGLARDFSIGWSTQHAPVRAVYSPTAGDFWESQNVTVVAGHAENTDGDGGFWWVWKVEPDQGQVSSVLKFDFPADFKVLGHHVADIVTLEDNLYILGRFEHRTFELIHINADGEIVQRTNLFEDMRNLTLRHLLPISENRFLVVGDSVGSAVLAIVDQELKVVARGTINHNDELYMPYGAATIRHNNNLAVVGAMTGIPTNMLGDGDLQITLCVVDSDVKLHQRTKFSGRNSKMASIGEESIVVTYDKSSGAATDMWLVAFDSKLQRMWEQRIVQIPDERTRGFDVVADGRGKIYTAGVVDNNYLYLSSFNVNGNRLATAREKIDGIHLHDFVLVGTREGVLLVLNTGRAENKEGTRLILRHLSAGK